MAFMEGEFPAGQRLRFVPFVAFDDNIGAFPDEFASPQSLFPTLWPFLRLFAVVLFDSAFDESLHLLLPFSFSDLLRSREASLDG